MYGVSGSWFRDLGFLQVRGFEYGVLGTGFRYGISGSGFPGMGFWVRGCGGSGTAFLVICSGFSGFGVSGRGFRGSGFRVGVFAVRGFGYGVFGFGVFGFGVSRFEGFG